MKKIFFSLMIISLAACDNNGNKSDTGDTASAPVTPGIENVNGNLPDTTNSISLDSQDTTKTTRTDTTRR